MTTPARSATDDSGGLDVGQILGLLALFVAVWLLWSTWLVYPLKILVVFFHELSHGLAAILTGGSIDRIEVVAGQGGVCWTVGGNRFWILTAGYLGSLLCGGVILVTAARTRFDRQIVALLGATLVVVALLWVRPLLSFGMAFALLVGLALLAAAAYLPDAANDYLLKAIGLVSVLYAVLDIRDDVLRRPHLLESDAAQLARLTGLPTLFWGALWIVIALAGAAFFLLLAGSGRRRIDA